MIESWNGANDFILYGRGGEIATDRLEDQEATMLALPLLQNCMGLRQHSDAPARASAPAKW